MSEKRKSTGYGICVHCGKRLPKHKNKAKRQEEIEAYRITCEVRAKTTLYVKARNADEAREKAAYEINTILKKPASFIDIDEVEEINVDKVYRIL